MKTLYLQLNDTAWPYTYTDHERQVARAIVFDADGFVFARVRHVLERLHLAYGVVVADDFGVIPEIDFEALDDERAVRLV